MTPPGSHGSAVSQVAGRFRPSVVSAREQHMMGAYAPGRCFCRSVPAVPAPRPAAGPGAGLPPAPPGSGGCGGLGSSRRAAREVCHGRPGRMSSGPVMAGTGGHAGPPRCWLVWTTAALSRSGIYGAATAAGAGAASMQSGGSPSRSAAGELFALLGTNGAGKTSTMEALEGLAPPAEGTVRVLGADPFRERARIRRRMGIMLQEGGFPADLTVAETSGCGPGHSPRPRPVAEALDLVGLSHRGGVIIRSLSGGERRPPGSCDGDSRPP